MAKGRKTTFSPIKLAKSNSRASLGSPPPQRVVPDTARKRTEQPRFRETLSDLLTADRDVKESR